MRVLVAEHDAALSMFLKRGLEVEGYSVQFAADGETALASASASPPELLILDLHPSDSDGTEVLRALQHIDRPLRTLMLNQRTSLQHRISCLDLGAADYLQRPFYMRELLACCRAIERRKWLLHETVIVYGDVKLHRLNRTVERAGVSVELTLTQHAMLDYLLEHRGRILDRTELLAEVFHLSAETQTNVVDVYISCLRSKLKVKPESPPLIETVRGRGYTIRPETRPEPKRTVQGASPSTGEDIA